MTNWLSYGYRSGAAADDFNGDGRDDFAVGNFEYGTVDVALASSTGALGGHTSFWVGYNAGAVAAADLSGDGKADLVSANWYSNNVGVLLGDGLGGFGNVVNYAAGGTPVGVVLGDFNAHDGDGNLDIAVSTSSGSGVSVLLGRGNGTFTPSVPSTSDGNLVGVATGDFNGDGWLDAAAANSSGTAPPSLSTIRSGPRSTLRRFRSPTRRSRKATWGPSPPTLPSACRPRMGNR